ncbi:hypothetical protein [Pontibacter sp. G13]|uniref:hypothetical protein n=1 Tax=Pontibacter sp. G13 TaxID=3074898 RepID=UPI00288B19DD|nr:hypothetical protein [Pontibacter sp. G13]WNJ17189.1 hypothetical protein RJD25_20225 [Pontibacter sp. G13]
MMETTRIRSFSNIFPDGTTADRSQVVHVHNVDLSNEETFWLGVKLISAKIFIYNQHLPKEISQIVKIDCRGQKLQPYQKNAFEKIQSENFELIVIES